MKLASKGLAALVVAGLMMGVLSVAPASAGDKKGEHDIVKLIDADLKRLDKELFGWLRKDHKR
jgi:hypothetical protein